MKKLITMASAMSALLFSLAVHAQEIPETITVTSSIFEHHGTIPRENTAWGDNTSIDLSWSNLPEGTVHLALICDDPVAVEIGLLENPFMHWVMYNIPASAPGIPGGLPAEAEITGIEGLEGAIQGNNGLGRAAYFGPRPPVNGVLHAYHFRVYAIDTDLGLEPGLNADELLEAIDGHVLATGMLMGHYEHTE